MGKKIRHSTPIKIVPKKEKLKIALHDFT